MYDEATGHPDTYTITVCTKGHVFHTFSYSHRKWVVYFVVIVMMILRHAPALHGASAQRMRIKYFIFATTKYSVLTLLLRDKCNICVWGGTAKGHRAEKRSSR